MEPITRDEIFMATAAGEYSGELPEPVTRSEFYWQKIAQRIDAGGSVSPESIDAAIEAYLNSHDADIVTEQELSDALAGYYDKSAVDTALSGKADATATQTALNAKQNALTAGAGISISNGEISNTAPNVKPDWNAASGTDAEILNKPTIPSYSNATASAAGLMSAADKEKLDGQGVVLWESTSGTTINDQTGSNTISFNHNISDYRFIEVYLGTSIYKATAKAIVSNGSTEPNVVNIQLIKDTARINIIPIIFSISANSGGTTSTFIVEQTSYLDLYSSGSNIRFTIYEHLDVKLFAIIGYR